MAIAATAPLPCLPTDEIGPDPFNRLGLYGLGSLAPVLLGALATEEPLLLIGPHGTGKTLLLTRIAETLNLRFRHYNASLLNFDDLVGFPVPSGGTLEYLQTPATIWGAEAVLFDEISRCRPEVQNKLFPIVHERRVQGLALPELKFRWAAMNPPLSDDSADGYLGSEPLDAALADRFAFIVEMPLWEQWSPAEQLAVIRGDAPAAPARDGLSLAGTVGQAQALRKPFELALGASLGEYLRTLSPLMTTAGIRLSPRRLSMLYRSAIAVHAAAVTLDADASPAESVLLTLRHGIAQRAEGRRIPEAALLGAHKEAWRLAAVAPDHPLKAVLTTVDPIERVRVAIAMPGLDRGAFSGVVADVLAGLRPGAREAVAAHLFESGAVGRLNAAIADQTGMIYGRIASPTKLNRMVQAASADYRTWQRIKDLMSRLDPAEGRAHLCANMLAACYGADELKTPDSAQAAYEAFLAIDGRLHGGNTA